MKPEKFSPFEMHGDKKIFEKRLKEGYTEVAHGEGEWIENCRIISIWAFFYPKKFFEKVATYEYSEFYDGENTSREIPFETTYTEEGFKRYCEKNKISLGKRKNLAKLIQNWNE